MSSLCARHLFDTTNQDSLVELSGLGNWLEEKAGVEYLNVAIENQGVVTWYVTIGRSDDPPVLQAPDGNLFEAVVVSNAFSNFVFDIIANNFSVRDSGVQLAGKATLPDRRLLRALRRSL